MSSISVSNILPSRTRSGRPWSRESGPWNHLENNQECPQTPKRRSPSVPVMPTTPTKQRPRVNTQALDVLCRASIYVNLLGQSKELYLQQVEYIRDMDMKGREKKFELMTAYETLHRRVNDLIALSGKQATLQEIENYSELVGWLSRMSVFHQLVSVL